MLGVSININNLCYDPVVLKKKLGKPRKNCFFVSNLHKKGVIMGHAQNEKQIFWGRNNKIRSSAFRNFLFHQNIICFGWIMNLFLSSVMFFVKKDLKKCWDVPVTCTRKLEIDWYSSYFEVWLENVMSFKGNFNLT